MHFHWKNYLWAGFLLTTILFLGGADGSGCGGKNLFESMGDDNSKEAKVEKARIAVDKKEYPAAIQTLEELCGTVLTSPTCDPGIVSLYASAYAGSAGLNVFNLIAEGANRLESPDSSFTLFSSHFAAATSQEVGDMNNALILLKAIPSQAPRTPDQGLQLALTSTSHLVMTLGTLTNGYDPTSGKPTAIPSDIPAVAAALPVVQADTGSMGTGLNESGIASEKIGSHISQIQTKLSNADAAGIIDFLSKIQ